MHLEPPLRQATRDVRIVDALEVVSSIPNSASTAILVGHKPGLHLLANLASDDRHMLIRALARIEFDEAGAACNVGGRRPPRLVRHAKGSAGVVRLIHYYPRG